MPDQLYLYNTLTRKKERFQPRLKDIVRMFTCGPSIYARPHIGNYRTFLYEDVLHRYLEYRGYRVRRLINFTDVEDKAIVKAEEQGTTLAGLTEPNAAQFKKDAAVLKIGIPPEIPRASTSVGQAVELVQKLIAAGHAYWHAGDVFYDPLTFDGFGKLYGLDMSRWPSKKRRFRRDTYPGQRWNLGDFILWHGGNKKHADFTWKTEIGTGRPAWNIQDAAMITEHLGYEVDICCGGVDNLYRHHDYTIAVIEGITGREFSHYWLHGEHVLADGVKMSKSRGNIVYLQDLMQEGFSAGQIRFFLMTPHYRRKMNLTSGKLQEAGNRLEAVRNGIRLIRNCRPSARGSEMPGKVDGLLADFEKRMNDDLDVDGAVKAVETHVLNVTDMIRSGKAGIQDCRNLMHGIKRINDVLQILL